MESRRLKPGPRASTGGSEPHAVEPAGDHGFAYRCLYPSAELLCATAESVAGRRVGRTLALPPVIHDARMAPARLRDLRCRGLRGDAALARDPPSLAARAAGHSPRARAGRAEDAVALRCRDRASTGLPRRAPLRERRA